MTILPTTARPNWLWPRDDVVFEAGYFIGLKGRKQYVRRYFGVDVADPHHHHLVVNSGKLGYQEASKIIVDAGSPTARRNNHLESSAARYFSRTPGPKRLRQS